MAMAEYFLRKGRSTLFAMPMMEVFVFCSFPLFKIKLTSMLKAFSLLEKVSTSSMTIILWGRTDFTPVLGF